MATPRTRRLLQALVVLAGIAVLTIALVNHRWFDAVVVVGLVIVGLIVRRRTKPVQLACGLGQHERHQVEFWFDKFWGDLSITVDGKPVVRDLRLLSVKLTKTYDLTVGDREVHDVRIEKDRALMFAGARAQPVRAYVDGVLAAEAVG